MEEAELQTKQTKFTWKEVAYIQKNLFPKKIFDLNPHKLYMSSCMRHTEKNVPTGKNSQKKLFV